MARYSRVLGVVLLCSALIAGCRSALPTASVACVSATLFREAIPKTIENLAVNASTIVVGTFTGYGPALWETPDGTRPATYDTKDPNQPGIVTPLSIDVAGVVQGRREAVGHAVIPGGRAGCDQLFAMERLTLDAGQRYVVFLNTNTRQGEVTGYYTVMDAWPISPDDLVQTRMEGSHPLRQVIRELQNGKADPTPTFKASEPTGGGYP